jgi:hypothetical protein
MEMHRWGCDGRVDRAATGGGGRTGAAGGDGSTRAGWRGCVGVDGGAGNNGRTDEAAAVAAAAPADALARGAKETAEGEAPREGGGTAAAIRRAAGESAFPVMAAWATGADSRGVMENFGCQRRSRAER